MTEKHYPHSFQEQHAHPHLIDDINYRISTFIRTFTVVVQVALAGALTGLLMRWFFISGGSFIFIFSMVFLTLLFLAQIGLSFFYIISNIKLSLLGAFSSLALALSFLALIFRFQQWPGWQVMLFIAAPVFIITAVLVGMYLAKAHEKRRGQRRFLIRNLLIPYIFIIALAVLSFLN